MAQYALVSPQGELLEIRTEAPNVDQTQLAPGKPRLLEIVDVNASFNPDTQVREGPDIVVSPTQYRRIYTVRSKNAAETDVLKQRILRSLNAIAQDKIGNIMSQDQQFLLLTAGMEGIFNHGLDRTTWPAALRNVFNPLFNTATNEVKAVYTVLRTKRQEVNALSTADQLAAYDKDAGWPT